MLRLRRARGFDQAERASILALLAGPGCPICRAVDQATSRFLFWYVNESFEQPELLDRVRGNLGMCRRHTRDLIAMDEASVLTTVLRELMPSAAARLDGPAAGAGCLVCGSAARSAAYHLGVLVGLLDDEAVARELSDSGGLCVAHTLDALRSVPPRHARLLMGVLRGALTRPPAGRPLVDVLGGSDPDGTLRRHLRGRLPDEPLPATGATANRATLDRLRALLDVDACPACLARGQSERRYLRWLAAGVDGRRADRSRGTSGREDLELCGGHLHDLAGLDPVAGEAAAQRLAGRWCALLDGCDRFVSREELLGSFAGRRALARRAWASGGLPGQRRVFWYRARSAAAALLESRRHVRQAALGALQMPWCRACHAVESDTGRVLELLLAGLRDHSTARSYRASHGLCAQHVLGLPADGRAAPAREVLLARLDLLGWELAEADRKRSWTLRYQPVGAEAGAWLRAAAMLDGGVYLGAPATRLAELSPGTGGNTTPTGPRTPALDDLEPRR